MNKLWTFGDSFTAGHGCRYSKGEVFSKDNLNNYYHKIYKDYIVSDKKIWNEIVSEALSMDLVDLSANGISTETIFDDVLKSITSIDKNDIVIIQTSTIGRFDFPFLKEKSIMGNNVSTSPYFFKTIFANNCIKEYSEDLENMLQYINAQTDLKNNNLKLNKIKYDTIRNFFSEFIMTEKYYERSVYRIVKFTELLKSMGIVSYIVNEDIWPIYLQKPSNLIEIHPKGMFGYVISSGKTIYADTNGEIEDLHPSYDGHADIANFIINFIQNEITNIHHT